MQSERTLANGTPFAKFGGFPIRPRPLLCATKRVKVDEMKAAAVFGLCLVIGAPALAQDLRPAPRPESGGEAAPSTLVMSSKSPMPRPTDLMQRGEVRTAIAEADEASRPAAGGPVVEIIADWRRLREGKGDFADYQAFLARNADWPGLQKLRRRGEAAIGTGADPAQVIAYFDVQAPQTGTGALRLAEAYLAKGEEAKAEAVLVAAWTGLVLSDTEETRFLADHKTLLKPHHMARLDNLLWLRERSAAERMLKHVGDDWKALARARMALQRKAGNVDAMIKAVPAALRDHPGLAYERMDWAAGKRRRDQAAELILASSGSAATLGRPEAWAGWRAILARQAMRAGDGEKAYRLASSHHVAEGTQRNDLEWLSGYLALRYLDRPDLALKHFQAFTAGVYTPISLGRAGYWRGRAYEAMGAHAAATEAYRHAARHQTSFYGLLAAEKAAVPMDRALTGLVPAASWRQAEFTKSSVFQAAGIFHESGQTWEAVRFLSHLAESLDEDDLIRLADYTLSLGDEFLAVKISKKAARGGAVAPRAYFPLRRMGDEALPVSEALALSIARRESEFHAAAVSHAGARGLMQLMPGTARQMAGKVGLPYSKARLTTDPDYNIKLGSAYLAHLIEQFGENIILISASYNAGPHRARGWMDARGDPRDPDIDVVDWIEHIPFDETRNYVMRVAESLPVYRARLSGRVAPITLSEELKAR